MSLDSSSSKGRVFCAPLHGERINDCLFYESLRPSVTVIVTVLVSVHRLRRIRIAKRRVMHAAAVPRRPIGLHCTIGLLMVLPC